MTEGKEIGRNISGPTLGFMAEWWEGNAMQALRGRMNATKLTTFFVFGMDVFGVMQSRNDLRFNDTNLIKLFLELGVVGVAECRQKPN